MMIDTEMLAAAAFTLPKTMVQFARDRAAGHAVNAIEDLGVERLLIVGTSNAELRHEDVWQSLAPITAGRFFGAKAHCPVDVVEACRHEYEANDCDAVAVIGGGSTIGLGKILAAEQGAKFVALPTTYSGSEMTAIFGRKDRGQKKTAVDDACRPDIVIYDGALSAGLPRQATITSVMNSIAHAAEALYPSVANPIAATLAEECLRILKRGLADLLSGQNEISARTQLLYGGCLGGLVIGMSGIALHHRLCHVIGGLYDLPHRESNSAVLPQALAYNRKYIEQADKVISKIFEGDNAGQAVFDFADRLDAPLSLRDIGMPPDGVDQVVASMLSHEGYNPRPLEKDPLRHVVQNAFDGTRPD